MIEFCYIWLAIFDLNSAFALYTDLRQTLNLTLYNRTFAAFASFKYILFQCSTLKVYLDNHEKVKI